MVDRKNLPDYEPLNRRARNNSEPVRGIYRKTVALSFITDRGKPAHVLLSFDDYQKLTKQRRNIADALAMPGIADIEFEPPRVTIQSRPADFS